MDKYGLGERTASFSEKLISFCSKIKPSTVYTPLVSQLVRSGTSVGANYREANAASSRKDFKNKIHICKKEAQETEYWLRLMLQSGCDKAELEFLQKETHEFILIFGKIISTMNSSNQN